MKKILFLMMVAFTVIGCNKDEYQRRSTPEKVTITIDYGFWESGNMSRAGADLYSNFYNKYIKTKLLTPTSYSLSLKTKETYQATTINGYWNSKDGIRLIEGVYDVTGTSTPKNSNSYVDSLALSFNEKVTITKETTSITLTAINSSYMLIFDASNIDSILYTESINNGIKTYKLKQADNIFYVFISKPSGNSEDKIVITRKNNSVITIRPLGLPFEKGKYYYFNDVTNSFDIPPMQEGN